MQEVGQRRLIPFISAYAVGGWGVVQVIAFMEERMMFSPHLVNFVGLLLLSLLPSVIILAWCHGRPGRDHWGRIEKISIPVNVAAAAALLIILFNDKDLGATTETVEVLDENGTVTERVIPKNEFRRRAIIYYFENEGDPADDWLRQGLSLGITMDIGQDPFVDIEPPILRASVFRREGFTDGLGLPRPLLRKIARESHCPHFVTGSYKHDEQGLTLTLVFHQTATGRIDASHTLSHTDMYALIDEASVLVRRELGVPEAHIESHEDLPVADISTTMPEALRLYLEGVGLALHHNDWMAARVPLEQAVELDPTFSLAHSMLFAANMISGDQEAAHASMERCMEYLYRLSERSQFQMKAIYYYAVKPDRDKTMAVLNMWTRLYPNDVAAYRLTAQFSLVHEDKSTLIGALEKILEIDPTQYEVLLQLANIHQEEGDFAAAEPLLLRYSELNPTDARGLIQLADLYSTFGKLEQAREALEQAQIMNPNQIATQRSLADIDERLGRFDEAENALQSLLAAADNDGDRLRVLGNLLSYNETRGQYAEGRERLAQWVDMAQGDIPAGQIEMVQCVRLARLITPDQADRICDEFDDLIPKVAPPNNRMMGLYSMQALVPAGRLDEAAAAVKEAEAFFVEYQVDGLQSLVDYAEAVLAEARGDLAGALAFQRKAYADDLTEHRYLHYLCRLLRLNGERDEAERELTKALESRPGHPVPNLEMALLWVDRRQPAKARPYLEKALAAWSEADLGHTGAAEARRLADELDIVQ